MPDDPNPQSPDGQPDASLAAPDATAIDASPQTDATQADASPDGADTPAPPSWSALKTVDELLAHDDLKPHLERTRDEGREEGRAESRRVQSLLERQRQQTEAIDGKLSQFVKGWEDLIEATDEAGNPRLSEETIRKLVRDHGDAFSALGGLERQRGQFTGYQAFVHGLASMAKSDDVRDEFLDRVDALARNPKEKDETFFDDLYGALMREAAKPLKERIKELEAAVANKDTELRAAQRNGEGPAPAGTPAGRGAGGGYKLEELAKMSPQQIAQLDQNKVDAALAGR